MIPQSLAAAHRLLSTHRSLPTPHSVDIQEAPVSVWLHLYGITEVAAWAAHFGESVTVVRGAGMAEVSTLFRSDGIDMRVWAQVPTADALHFVQQQGYHLVREGVDIPADRLTPQLAALA